MSDNSFEFFIKDAWRNENQEFGLRVALLVISEQHAEARNIAEEWHLRHGRGFVELVDTAEHHSLSVVDQDGRRDLALVQLRHEAAAGVRYQRGNIVLLHVEHQKDAAVGSNRRRNLELQHSLLELDGGCCCAGRTLERHVADLLALFDVGLLLVGSNDSRTRYQLAPALGLTSRKLEVEQIVCAKDREP